MNGYGEITKKDVATLESVLSEYSETNLKYLEVGVWHGDTSAGIAKYCKRHNIKFECWGIDMNKPDNYVGHFITGVSEYAWESVPDNFDVIFIDGCHCLNHVILDLIHYGNRIVPGGFILIHDTAPHLQNVQTNDFMHPDSNHHFTMTNKAIELVGWPNNKWELIADEFDPESTIGGMKVFRKNL